MKPRLYAAILASAAMLAAFSRANAQTVLFDDTYSRGGVNSVGNLTPNFTGETGADVGSGVTYISYTNSANTSPPNSFDIQNSTLLKSQTGQEGIWTINYNFTDAAILSTGGFSVSQDIVAIPSNSSQPQDRFCGYGVGSSLAQARDFNDDTATSLGPRGSITGGTKGVAPFYVDLDSLGAVQIFTGGTLLDSIALSGSPTSGTLTTYFFGFSSFNAGATVDFIVLFNGTILTAGSFAWGSTGNNYIAGSMRDSTVTAGEFDVSTYSSGNLTPSSAVMLTGTNVVITGTEQAVFDVTLAATGTNVINAAGFATNWISSNPNVLQVNSSGLITGVSVGTATVSATVNGVTATSGNITVTPQVLEHRYSFVSNASDSVGGANGIIVPPGNTTNGQPATIDNGLSLPGDTAGGFGYSGYVLLPPGLLTNTTSITLETWFTQNQGNQWATVWDFADNGSTNFELCPTPNSSRNNGLMISAFTPDGNESDIDSDITFPNGSEQYVAVTYNNYSLLGSLYTNGVLNATLKLANGTYCPGTFGGSSGTVSNMLGNDIFGDDQFNGTIYEFRIWNGAVTPLYLAVAAAAGPSVLVTNLTPTDVTITVTNDSMIQGVSQPATATADFTEASGIVLTGSATNWISSDTGVLTVNSNGVISAVGTGSATISATVAGVIGTSASITVPNSAPTITQPPPASDEFLQGATLTASVGNIGTPPFVYRWFFGSGTTPISTSASPALTVPDVQPGSSGTYSVLVSNAYGSALSSSLSVSVVSPTPYEETVLQYGPLGYWPLQETGGTVAYDVIGGDNGAYESTSVAGSAVTPGASSGPSQSFFGNSSVAPLFQSAIVDIPEAQLNITGPITIVAWVQIDGLGTDFYGIFAHGDQSWRLTVNDSGQPGANDGAPPADATDPIAAPGINGDNNWHMVTYSYNGNTNQADNGSFYVDGALVATNSVFVPPAGDNLDVWIGGSPDYGTQRLLPFASIAHAAVFTQAFNAAQVQGLYNGTYVSAAQTLNIAPSGSNVVLTWQAGTLLESTNVMGPWTTNSSATSPYTLPATGQEQFFRLLVP